MKCWAPGVHEEVEEEEERDVRFSVFWKISDDLDGSLVECFHSINGGPRCVLRLIAEYSGKSC